MEKLINNLMVAAIEKGEKYDLWEREISICKNRMETSVQEEARVYLLEHEYDGLQELMELDYIQYLSEDDITFKPGQNKENVFLVDMAFTLTEECGYITASENDYYEVAREQAEIAKEYVLKEALV